MTARKPGPLKIIQYSLPNQKLKKQLLILTGAVSTCCSEQVLLGKTGNTCTVEFPSLYNRGF
jgi:hypothetical protein